MGACQSREPVAVAADMSLRKSPVGGRHQAKNTFAESMTPSLATDVTQNSSDHVIHHNVECNNKNKKAPGGGGTNDETPDDDRGMVCQGATKNSSHAKSKHARKKSGIVKDYLEAEGASSNRVMVHIESLFGLPIEEVYEGVHNGHVLGEGVAGVVRLITHRETGIKRAVKRLDCKDLTDEHVNRLLDEIKIMCSLDHPHVVTLEEVFEGEDELFLTQELCEGGDLFDRLDDQPDYCYTEEGCARVIKQIISAVSYLHSKDIIHRDLKLENFLFMDRTDDSLKMIDFGLSKHFIRGEIQHEKVGTQYTVAPEVLLDDGYDERCDVWAIGVITYLLLSGESPFGGAGEGTDPRQVAENILSGEVSFEDPIWDCVSGEAIDFIQSMLVLDPTKRPKATELNDHPWLIHMKRNSSIIGSDESTLSPTVVRGLVSFKELGKTQAFLREIISFTLQPDQIAGLREEFEKIDVDGTGEISLKCFREALVNNSGQHPLSEAEIEEIFAGMSIRNTDMSIRWHEFIAACLSQCHIDDRNIRLAFDRLDTERKGHITLQDLKTAMKFYGSNSRYDLQAMWIEEVLDYKSEKDTMDYDDFYKLLKLDKSDRNTGDDDVHTPLQSLRKSAPPSSTTRRGNSSLTRSYVNGSNTGLDKHTLDMLTSPLDCPSSCPGRVTGNGSKRRRASLGPVHNLDLSKILLEDQDPSANLITNVKRSRDIHDFILEASKRVEDEKKQMHKRKRRLSMTGGLIMCRDSDDHPALIRTLSK